jgi:hypothetical protein
MCLKELAGCDYIILLDDDIWPVAPDWAALLIRAHEVSGIHHFVYVPETGVQDRPWATHFEPLKTFHYDGLSITSFNNCTGCLLFLTQTVIQRVGGMMIYPAHYGFEHAGYSRRIHSAGLMQNAGPYTCVDGFAPRIWSVDMQGLPQDLVGYHTASSMVTAEVAGAVAMNLKAFEKDTQIYQPLEEESRHCRAGRWD